MKKQIMKTKYKQKKIHNYNKKTTEINHKIHLNNYIWIQIHNIFQKKLNNNGFKTDKKSGKIYDLIMLEWYQLKTEKGEDRENKTIKTIHSLTY